MCSILYVGKHPACRQDKILQNFIVLAFPSSKRRLSDLNVRDLVVNVETTEKLE